MRQVAQPINGGMPRLVDVPPPALRPGGVIVRTAWSLVSPGTERLVIGLAGQSLIGKARSRPDQVRKVLARLRTDGLKATLDAVRARLASEIPLGYSAAGWVEEVGEGVDDLRPGDAVACAGMGYASHAERIFVPRNLARRVPEGLPLREAATVTLGAIALHGVRRGEIRLGERVGVVGLGILGLLSVQILRASGAHVFAVDLDPRRCELARGLGAEVAFARDDGDLPARARAFSAGHGLDAVLVTAASDSSDPTILGAECCRTGGRIVVVGAVGVDIPRRLLYERELEVRAARSYGPGRYDPIYEERGIDYPYAWVRFTEGRNMEEYLSLLGRGEVDVAPLLTHEYGIAAAGEAYRFLMSEEGRGAVGLLFRYGAGLADGSRGRPPPRERGRGRPGALGIGLVGAGLFARGTLLPLFSRLPGVVLTGVATATGLSGDSCGRQWRFRYATTDPDEVLEDPGTDAVVVATRHGDHASLAARAMRAGKDVFLEKPLALTLSDLEEVSETVRETGRILMVGFNRRFSPLAAALGRRVRPRSAPLTMAYRVDAGALPPEHWTLDPVQGGGRIRGEACHFVDLLSHLAGAPVVRVWAEALPGDGVAATLRFSDGSAAALTYAVSGDPAGGKERLEVLGEGFTAVLDDFRTLRVSAGGRVRRVRAPAGKGHREEVLAFVDAVRRGMPTPLPFAEAAAATRATLALVESAGRGVAVEIRG